MPITEIEQYCIRTSVETIGAIHAPRLNESNNILKVKMGFSGHIKRQEYQCLIN